MWDEDTAEDTAGGCGSMNPAFLMQPPLFTNSALTGDFDVVFFGNINMYVCVFIVHICMRVYSVCVCLCIYTSFFKKNEVTSIHIC